jgi:polyhydroxybutyrate depolymerase
MRAAVGTADVTSVRRVLDRLASCVDTDRVVIAGFSNGAGFGARIACELAPRIHGAVLVAGSYRAIDPCPSDGPRMPIAELHAAGDPHAHAADELVATWRRRDGCTAGADCPVSSMTLPGHRHTWPDAATAALTRLLR